MLIGTLKNQCQKYNPNRIVIEATGRLEMPFILACAKTDKLDAQLIAHYSEAIKPELSRLKPEKIKAMSDLVTRRNQLLTMQTIEKNRAQIMPKKITHDD
jgi:transposase